MTPERRAELRKLIGGATEGPWTATHKNSHNFFVYNYAGDAELGTYAVADVRWKENADFISVARTALPEALDALEAAERQNEKLLGVIECANNNTRRGKDREKALREAISPGRVNVSHEYYIAVAKRMRANETVISPKDAALAATEEPK